MNESEKILFRDLPQSCLWIGAYQLARHGYELKLSTKKEQAPSQYAPLKGLRKQSVESPQAITQKLQSLETWMTKRTAAITLLGLRFHGKTVGFLEAHHSQHLVENDLENLTSLGQKTAPLFFGNFERNLSLLQWIEQVRNLAPENISWVGLYYKASWLLNESSTDLVLGPYLGPTTEHTRIPIDRGFCGLALSEERTVVVPDVTKDSKHIVCDLRTRSEIVVPLLGSDDEFIAELDVDSHQLNTFQGALGVKIQDMAKEFSKFI